MPQISPVPQVTRRVTQGSVSVQPRRMQTANAGAGTRGALIAVLLGVMVILGLGVCAMGLSNNNGFFGILGIFSSATPTPTRRGAAQD